MGLRDLLFCLIFLIAGLNVSGQGISVSKDDSGLILIEEFDLVDSATIELFQNVKNQMIQKQKDELKPNPDEEQKIKEWYDKVDLLTFMMRDFVSVTTLEFDTVEIKKTKVRGETILQRFDIFSRLEPTFYKNKIHQGDTLKYKINEIAYNDSLYLVSFDSSNIKVLSGYKCYKLTVQEKIDKPSAPYLEFGLRTFDMWVTDQIEIPLYVVMDDIRLKDGHYFPLLIEDYYSNIPGLRTIFKVTQINVH